MAFTDMVKGLLNWHEKYNSDMRSVETQLSNKAQQTYVDKQLSTKVSQLLTDVDYYVSSAGDDVNGDGSETKPWKTIMIAIEKIPKNLGSHAANIWICGNHMENIRIYNFYNGQISLRSESLGISHIDGEIVALKCQANILLRSLSVKCNATYDHPSGNGVIIANNTNILSINLCKIDGNNKQRNGVLCWGQGNIGVATSEINNTQRVISTESSSGTRGVSSVQAYSLTGSNNDIGIYCTSAIVAKYNTMSSATTAHHIGVGGVIVNQSGAVLGA